MKEQTQALEHASVKQYCKALRVPMIGANFVRLAEQAIKEQRSHIGYLEALLTKATGSVPGSPDRHSVAGAKDDRRDAFVLADSLRTDQHCFKQVQIDDPMIIRIRELSRLEDDLQQDWCRLTNQLGEQLHRYYPQMLHLSPAADDPWLWELLGLVPLPAQISRWASALKLFWINWR